MTAALASRAPSRSRPAPNGAFTAGPDDESHGILGVLSPQLSAVPEPSSLLLMAAGLAAAGAFTRKRRSR